MSQWQRWEKGESEPYKRNLAKLSEAFGVPIGEFFEPRGQAGSQLDRIEAQLNVLLRHQLPDVDLEQEIDKALELAERPLPNSAALSRTPRRLGAEG